MLCCLIERPKIQNLIVYKSVEALDVGPVCSLWSVDQRLKIIQIYLLHQPVTVDHYLNFLKKKLRSIIIFR